MSHLDARRRALAVLGVALLAVALPTAALARGSAGKVREQNSKAAKLAFFDSRDTPRARQRLRDREDALADASDPATDALRDDLGAEGVVSIDPLTSTPRVVARLDGLLTGPSSSSAKDVALGYARTNAKALGLDAKTLDGLELARDYVSIDGTHHLYFVQKVNGVPVFGNGLRANVTQDGRLINVLGSPVLAPASASGSPGISAAAAIAAARSNAREEIVPVRTLPGRDARRSTTFSNGDSASLVYFQSLDGLRLSWQAYVSAPGAAFLYVVDAANGAVLYRRSLVDHADALVYENYPGAPVGGTQAQKSISKAGWLTSSTTLSGHNTHVYSDIDDSNDATNVDGDPEEIPPSGGGNWLYPITPFTFVGSLNTSYHCDTFLCTWNPSVAGDADNPSGEYSYEENRLQDGAQLFYLINTFHDHLRKAPIGFTPAAGNFEDADPVLGEALDGANSYGFGFPDPNHTDNANFATPPDGQSPRMQMFLWHDPTTDYFDGPDADPFLPSSGANEADIVYHEYTHGLSNRLVVDSLGNSTLGNIQAGAMGEAWSDWYAFDFLVKDGKWADTQFPGDLRVGQYVGAGQDLIRTQPLDCPVGTSSSKCPGTDTAGSGGYTYGDFGKVIGRPEVHADGEIWGETLWDLRAALGSDRAESLVTRAMELAPSNPSFLDMRNSILMADQVAGGRSRDTVWSVFSHRGMGFYAASVDGDDAVPVEDYNLPPGRRAQKGTLSGNVTDADTHKPIKGVLVAFGGHASGFPGDFSALTKKNGNYAVRRVYTGTYPKVSASGAGYDTITVPVTIDRGRTNVQNYELRRDWAALGGGGSVASFNGPDYTGFGCGPSGAIDQSQGSGWGSTTGNDDGDATTTAVPKFAVFQLPQAVNVSEIKVNPSGTCGDAGSSSTKDYRIETAASASGPWTLVKEGMFQLADRGQYVTVPGLATGGLRGVRYIRFTMLNPQVPLPDGTLPPFGEDALEEQCPGNFTGCQFMDMTELGVYGTPG